MPGAESFLLPASGSTACLMIHGFTGSPSEMRPLAERLQTQGVTTLGILLPGHGTSLTDLDHYGRRSWLGSANAALESILRQYDRVVLCGLSMGASIALNLAARHHDPRLVGLIALSAPARLIDHRYRVNEIVRMLQRWRDWGHPDIGDPSQRAKLVGYRLAPIRATIQLIRMVEETYRLLPRVDQPLLVIHGKLDSTVPPVNVHWLLEAVGSREREVVWLEQSCHVVTLDFESERVAQIASRFLARVAG